MCVLKAYSSAATVNVSHSNGAVTLTTIVLTTVTKKVVNCRLAVWESLRVAMESASRNLTSVMVEMTVEIPLMKQDVLFPLVL